MGWLLKIGIAVVLGVVIYHWLKRRLGGAAAMAPDEARRVLQLRDNAGLQEVRDAHRRLIAKVHPDAGGSAELATRVNAARDVLVAELNRRTPRAS